MTATPREITKFNVGAALVTVGLFMMVARPLLLDAVPRGGGDSPFWTGFRLAFLVLPLLAVPAGIVLLIVGARERRNAE